MIPNADPPITKHEDLVTISSNIDPLAPFFKPFYWSPGCDISLRHNEATPYDKQYAEELEKKYILQNRPINSDSYKDIFFKLISHSNFFTQKKANILEKMWQDSKFIYDALAPLRQLGAICTIDLTGGCVRDFILNNEDKIKDLDFMISIDIGQDALYPETLIDNQIFTKKEINDCNFDINDAYLIQKSKLLNICMNRTLEVSQTFSPCNSFVSYDMDKTSSQRLITIIKTTGNNTNYQIDLLLTAYSKPEFLNAFDFDICKASFCISNQLYNKDFPQHYTYLISRFSSELDFWADVINNKITFNVDSKSMNQIQVSFGDHLNRLIAKFPDHEVQIISNTSTKADKDDRYKYANELLQIIKLHKSLTEQLITNNCQATYKKKI
jgi:hypothetical protein